MQKHANGFTLIELLVVIAILGFLAATLVVGAVGFNQRAKIEKATALVRRIHAGCEAYFTKFQDYPSDYAKLTVADKAAGVSWPTISSDKYLYDYLARPLTAMASWGPGAGKTETLTPFVEFTASETSGPWSGAHSVQVRDPWGNAIWYELPGFDHGTNYVSTKRGSSSSTNSGFDVTCAGPNGTKDSFSDKTDPKDDITNWTR
jgi:prepilin-type N-terminal cleavage/methylation domain-containing protein